MAEATTLDHRIGVFGGLKLHVRAWTPSGARPLPVLCLPGLSRSLEDFTELAVRLSTDEAGPWRVIAISSRGRGESDRDPEPARYAIPVEAADALSVLDALGVPRVAVVGSSRGGLLALTLAAMRPAALAAVVFNDVGPVVEPGGLSRIKGYLTGGSRPKSWEEATRRATFLFAESFPALGPEDFARLARRSWREGPDGLEPACDPAVGRGLDALDLTKPLPSLWELFDKLADKPLLTVRGERSDILSPSTLAEMRRRRPDMEVFEVAGQGHTPLLADAPTQDAIVRFLSGVD